MGKLETVCIQCKKTFFVYRCNYHKAKFCSRDCYHAWRSKNMCGEKNPNYKKYVRVEKVCKGCGEVFFIIPSQDAYRQFCSYQCYLKSRVVLKKTQICPICGREFIHKRARRNGLYCSNKCRGRLRERRVTRTCLWCGKIFERRKSVADRDGMSFCSMLCWGKWKSKNLVGTKSPGWQGGLSFAPYCLQFNKDFKRRVREFFKNVCVECGMTEKENGQKLSVHHVNYDKMMCCNDVKPLFVALCRGHNTGANKDRKYWEGHYTNIINEKHGGKCYFTKEEMKAIDAGRSFVA